MTLSPRIESYLSQAHVDFDVIHHGFTENAYDSACAAHLPVSNVVKGVVLRERDQHHYVIAAIPASNKLKIPWINKELKRDFILAGEIELAAQFPDCVLGAVPAIGQAYDSDIIWDNQLAQQAELYIEAGSHEELIHIGKSQFTQLFQQYHHSTISLPAESYSLYHADEIRGGMN
ncbi:MAG: YbaK/EbsC family protein [Pseudomonadales bacterium]